MKDFNDAGADWEAYMHACRFLSGRALNDQDEIDALYDHWMADTPPAVAVRTVAGLVQAGMPLRTLDRNIRNASSVAEINQILRAALGRASSAVMDAHETHDAVWTDKWSDTDEWNDWSERPNCWAPVWLAFALLVSALAWCLIAAPCVHYLRSIHLL